MFVIVRQERLDDVKRTRLLEAALEEFAERGIESASYNKIIERSGLSKGTVYYYFDNKDTLLDTVLDVICRSFLDAIGDFRLPDTKEEYWETAWEYHKRSIQFFFENPLLARVLFWVSRDGVCIDEHMGAAHDRLTRFMDDLLVRGQEIGAVRSDLPIRTIHKLMHSMGKVFFSEVLEENRLYGEEADWYASRSEIQAKVEAIVMMVHDLSKRILTPEEDLSCLEDY